MLEWHCGSLPGLCFPPSGRRLAQYEEVLQVKLVMLNRRPSVSGVFRSFMLAVALTTVAWAVNFQPVNPEELKMASEPKAPGAPAIVLFR